MSRKLRLPGPTMVVALLALFVALSGTAVAAGVPALAKRALVADNAKKLDGKTSAALLATANTAAKAAAESAASNAAQQPGPASTAASLVAIKTAPAGQFGGGQFREVSISCDPGQKVMGGGLSTDGLVIPFDSYPSNDTTWVVGAGNIGNGAANASVWATCLK